ncbi:MAG: 50S ribosomal protein L15 [Firmicutes bacterium]|nr:50S ribosomal protein L15 [Bacillota bacterium]
MRMHDLHPAPGSRRERRRVGRGIGSGMGKTATKGSKGQLARSGGGKGPAFEGGQTPLYRRLPKRGFKNFPFKKEYAIVNVEDLERLPQDVREATPETLLAAGIIRDLKDGVKVLGDGELKRALKVRVHRVSESAAQKIAAAGGTVEVI